MRGGRWSDASIGAGATIVATGNVDATSKMNFDGDATANGLSIGGSLSVGLAAAGTTPRASRSRIGDHASVTANSVSVRAIGDSDTPYHYTAQALSVALGLGGDLAGSLAANAMANHTEAGVAAGATVNSTTNVDLLANVRRVGATFVDAGHISSSTVAAGRRSAACSPPPGPRRPGRSRCRTTSPSR